MVFLCLTIMAQGKITPQAQLSIARQKAKVARKMSQAKPQEGIVEPQLIRLVVKVAKDNASTTFDQMKAAGASILSRIGRQTVISIPIDSIDALERIDGVVRIDKGHKGRMKTDVTRQETGVNLLNGPETAPAATAYTGKGVTICLIDAGFDYQHPAFKDANGNSRIKCVYLIDDNGGNKFTVDDPEAGSYTFPGSVYDTPELIATLTTDDETEYHGTHTAGIAAGSLSPLGFGGMAPEADIVLVPLQEYINEEFEEYTTDDYVELAIAFAKAYAERTSQPMVLSVSANSHAGPHDGTSTVTEAIEEASTSLIPVFSAGNEGGNPIHLHQVFSEGTPSVNSILIGLMDDIEYEYYYMAEVSGFTRPTGNANDELGVQLTLKSINAFTGKLNTVWTSEKCTATFGCDQTFFFTSSDDDATLAKYFEGDVAVAAYDNGDGRLAVYAYAYGGLQKLYLFQITFSGADGTEMDAWDEVAGFGGVEYLGLPGLVDGDADMSAGDWTSTDRVVSVGAYCANTNFRDYNGTVYDTSVSDDPDYPADEKDEIAWYSSYGTSFNDITQPTVCAPGVNVVSSWSHYVIGDEVPAENMQWQGYPYGAESGTSMSCPVVSGIIALWLEAKPTLTFDDVKNVIANTSVNDNYTAAAPIRWGYGKIDAVKGIEYVTSTGIRTLDDSSSDASTSTLYDLQGRRLTGTPSHGIYIQSGKKIVIR